MPSVTGDEYTPKLSNATGTNYFDKDSGLLSIIIKGPQVIEVISQDTVIVSFSMPALSVDDFYGDNIVQNLASFLNIPLTKIRVVNVVSEGSRRRKRSTGIVVEVEIGDEPSSCKLDLTLRCTVKPVLSGHSKSTPKIVFQYGLSLNAGQKYCRMLQGEHSAILSTFIKLPFSIKTFVLSFLSGRLRQVLLYLM